MYIRLQIITHMLSIEGGHAIFRVDHHIGTGTTTPPPEEVAIVLHALWDMPFSTIPVLVLLIVIAWVFILALIRSGMSEINRLHEAQQAE